MQDELDGFITLLQKRKVTSYLEIGARHGDTFHKIMTSLPRGSFGLAVDMPGALWGTQKSRDYLCNVVIDLKSRGYQIECLFGNSQTEEMRTMIEARGPFDAIFIDGDHTLAGVTRDWENYKDMSKIIAFHDIVGIGQKEKQSNKPVEVPKLWLSLKDKYMTQEIIADHSQMGIGVCLL